MAIYNLKSRSYLTKRWRALIKVTKTFKRKLCRTNLWNWPLSTHWPKSTMFLASVREEPWLSTSAMSWTARTVRISFIACSAEQRTISICRTSPSTFRSNSRQEFNNGNRLFKIASTSRGASMNSTRWLNRLSGTWTAKICTKKIWVWRIHLKG